ncbi:MAG: nitrite/sulfite reductase [Rhodospirillaceae bacterium]|nr:nitrite/sulfite reductase [Rhodospirillaceae bacterium]
MYIYDKFDHAITQERVNEFSQQVARRLVGELSEEQFRPLRLMNGLYLQLHAYMLRVAIPYGTLSSKQMHKLADIAKKYDRDYGHFTTRQNIQYNWIKLEQVPEILAELASVEMHANQTSGNCIRNVTADQFAGVAGDEVEDPRIISEVIRQWSTFHPEFSFLPRKFKIAVTGAVKDRAAIQYHDIGIQIVKNDAGEIGYAVYVGGGMGRTPVVAPLINPFVRREDLLSYLETCLRVYNLHGRRDNIYKARIKILVRDLGPDEYRRQVDEMWPMTKAAGVDVPAGEVARIEAFFAPPAYEKVSEPVAAYADAKAKNPAFARWIQTNLHPHKVPGYGAVTISLKPIGGIPGDASSAQMHAIADLADKYSLGELRVTHVQNLVLPNVKQADLFAVYQELVKIGFADANIGLASDIIACPGLDYCALANARSIPVAQDLSKRFGSLDRQHEIGPLQIKISGCINACGHHHAGHIGILGVDKAGQELYQITLGGAGDEKASIGQLMGPGFTGEDIGGAVEKVVNTYLGLRQSPTETFIEAYRRVGPAPFKESLYGRR